MDGSERWRILRLHVEDEISLAGLARETAISTRTLQRWHQLYRSGGITALDPQSRADTGVRRTATETVALEGPASYRDRHELVFRRRAKRPNQTWQADHTELDILTGGADGKPDRPWLTTVMDDYSRAICGYTVFAGAPSALNTALALRQAIWRKTDPAWAMCGIPDILHVDHGSDFTSHHLERTAVELHIRIIHSTVGRPQGRGKIERFLCATRRALSYPRFSRGELEGRFLGLMAYPDTER